MYRTRLLYKLNGLQNIEMGHSNFLYYFAFGPDINIVLLVLTSIRKVKMSVSRKVYHPIKFLKRFQLSKMEKYSLGRIFYKHKSQVEGK